LRHEGINCRRNIIIQSLEPKIRFIAVANTPVVESHDRHALCCQVTGQQHELTMASNAILRAANHDKDPSLCRLHGWVDDAD
jgi:hypothetical protein